MTGGGPRIIPVLKYRNAAAAVDWLCDAFGFEQHIVVPGDEGTIAHAQLLLGNSMIMLGSGGGDSPFDRLQAPPGKDAPVTQSAYIVVDDVDAHYAQAKEAGAEIVLDIQDEDYGGRGYSCRDPEGYLWNFGSYDPWA